MSWDLQSDGDERLFSLSLRAVTRFTSFFPSFFQSIRFLFFAVNCPVCVDTLRCGFKAKSESRFGLCGSSAQLRTSGEAQRTGYLFQATCGRLCFLIGVSNPRVQRFGLVWAAGLSNIHEWMCRWIRCVELRNSGVAHRPARSADPVVVKKTLFWYLQTKRHLICC